MRFLRFFGVIVFVVSIFITILFAEGYQLDPKTHGLVKKSVLFFEGVQAPPEHSIRVWLDGKEVPYAKPMELRVAPGVHEVIFSNRPSHSEAKQLTPRPSVASVGATLLWKKRIAVPEESVVRFPEIQLVPTAGDVFAETIESIRSLERHTGSREGIFYINPRLHFGKFYFLEYSNKTWVQNIPFISKDIRLIPLSEDFWFGITAEGKLFSYDMILRRPTPRPSRSEAKHVTRPKGATLRADFAVQDARLFDETLFLLDREGKIWKLSEDDREPQFLFRIISPVSHIRRIEESNNRTMFLFDRLAVVIQDDGAILFQEPGVDSATLHDDTIFYTQGTSLTHFDLSEKKVSATHVLPNAVSFLSRIGESYEFLFVNSSLNIFMCDPDYENCSSLGKIDNDRIEVSKDRMRFFIEREGTLTLLDFERSGALPPFLENLVSFATRGKLFE